MIGNNLIISSMNNFGEKFYEQNFAGNKSA